MIAVADRVLAGVVAERVRALFIRERRGMTRLSGFTVGEIIAIVEALREWAGDDIAILVIGGEPIAGLPDSVRVRADKSATWYRNNCRACVFIEAGDYSDRQGLRNITTLSDGDILAGGELKACAGAVLTACWGALGAKQALPANLLTLCGEVAETLAENGLKPSVRRFVAFGSYWARAALALGVVDAEAGRRTLGTALPELGLFADSLLGGISGVALKRRLEGNVAAALGRLRSGREFDRDEIVDRVDKTEFTGLDGRALSRTALAEVRTQLRDWLQAHGRPKTENIEFHYWEQVFAAASTRKGVGERVREEIEAKAPGRRVELDALDVVEGLDSGGPEAARQLLESLGSNDEPALVELLTPGLRRQIERVAQRSFPAVAWPLRQLVRLLHEAREEAADEDGEVAPDTVLVELRIREAPEAELSAALFAFLYGPTLTRLATAERDWGLQVDPRLTDFGPLRRWCERDAEEDDAANRDDGDDEGGNEGNDERRWADLEIRLRRRSDQAILGRFRWQREQFAGHLLTACACFEAGGPGRWQVGEDGFETWIERAMDTGKLAGGQVEAATDDPSLLARTLALRSEALTTLAQRGLEVETIADYVREWSGLLAEFEQTFVPLDSSFDEVDVLLALDTVRFDGDQIALLATHPLRLRWIARHLESLYLALDGILHGTWRVNSINDGVYFQHLENASPHAQPPVLCDRNRVHVAVREECWHEHFKLAQDRKRTHGEWLAELDDASIDEMARIVGLYVDAHPHKFDGISILLIVRRGGTRFCQRVVAEIMRQRSTLGRLERTNMTLHVAADRSEFGQVSQVIEAFDDPSHRVASDFPRMRVILHPWREDEPLPGSEALNDSIDIAIVPNLFTAHNRLLVSHRNVGDRVGTFKPWIDPPTSRASTAGRAAMRDLLPTGRDETLERWSTLNVRHFRSQRVSEDEGVDYFSLRVDVGDSEALYARLHDMAHWVVTLDAFVGRNHIEALTHPPEVITTKPGLGKAGAHTLIVSSQVGRAFVVRRIARRLAAHLGDSLGVESTAVAELLYDRARELAPGTVLRAVGLGRTAQELVGLVVSKALVGQMLPVRLGSDGFEAWISLDAHQDWFGGPQAARADLLRLVGVFEDQDLRLRATVVEAKLRESGAVRRAESQVATTCRLLEDALRSEHDEPPADALVWRRAIVEAIDDVVRNGRLGRRSSFFALAEGQPCEGIDRRLRQAMLDGNYQLEIEGVVCTMTLDGSGGDSKTTPESGYYWIRASVSELRRILERLGDEPTPVPVDRSVASAVDPVAFEPPAEPPAPDVVAVREHAPAPAPRPGRQSHEQLLERYQKILSAFDEYGVEVRSDDEEPVLEGPGFYVFRVRPGRGIRPAKLRNYEEDLQYKLELPAGRLPRSYIDSGAVVFEVPKHESERYYIDAEQLWRKAEWPHDRLWVAVGEDVRGNQVSIDFSSNDTPHLLIGGITGSGKSVALETILVGLIRHYTPEQLQLSLVDPKGTELEFLRNDPHVDGEIGIYPEDAIELLSRMVDEMERRFVLMKQRRVRKISEYNQHPEVEAKLAWRLIVLDEYADLTSDRDDRTAIEQALQRLTQKARAAGIHVIVATQRPSAEVISTTVRSNLGAQMALRVKTAVDSRIIMDDTGAEALAGNGDAFLKGSGGDKIRLQCAKV